MFAGCGGLSLGFQAAGFNVVGAFENWEPAARCYEQNFDHPVFRVDLSNVEETVEIIQGISADIDLIVGGPPCQDFSHAGKRIEAQRAGLTESFAMVVSRIRPSYFVMENVDRTRNSNTFAIAETIFKEAGYGLTSVVLDASHCGIPQKRKRFFCIGALNEDDDFLLELINSRVSSTSTTLRDYFGETLGFECYYRHPRNYNRRAIFSIDEPSPTIRGVNRPVPNGYPGHPNDACDLDPSIRSMTTLERALVQTFPADFKWVGNKTEMEQMIGNAVPVKLAQFVAEALRDYVNRESEPSPVTTMDFDNFHWWLEKTQNLSARVKRDTISRLRRADTMCRITHVPDEFYLYRLEHSHSWSDLTPAVRSQIKRAVSLYRDYRIGIEQSFECADD